MLVADADVARPSVELAGEPTVTRGTQPARTPPSGPLLGHILEIRRDPLAALLRWNRGFGPVVRVKLRHWTYVLNDPSDVRHVLVSHQAVYHKGEAFKLGRSVFGDGLLASEEPLHLLQRHLMQPAFHRDALRSYAETMIRRSMRLAQEWGGGVERNVAAEMMRLTLGIAAETMFGHDDVAETEALAHAVDVAQDFLYVRQTSLILLPERFPTPLLLRHRHAVEVMDRLVYGIIESRRRTAGEQDDLLGMLLRARDDEGQGMSDRQLRDEALTLLLAGHETTANALSWTLLLLATHPEVTSRVLEELQGTIQDGVPTMEDIPRLRYTDQVVSEALRLYPPAWIIPRRAVHEDRLETGVTLPEGAAVVLSPWSMHRDPEFYPDPEAFRPERFESAAREARPPYAYYPFGGGNRRCIGEPFARMELALVLSTLLPRFRFDVSPGQAIVPEPRVTLRPRDGIRMTIRPRVPSGGPRVGPGSRPRPRPPCGARPSANDRELG
jgi:cytochrome P450